MPGLLLSSASPAGAQSASGTFGSRVTALVELAAAGTSCEVKMCADDHLCVQMPAKHNPIKRVSWTSTQVV